MFIKVLEFFKKINLWCVPGEGSLRSGSLRIWKRKKILCYNYLRKQFLYLSKECYSRTFFLSKITYIEQRMPFWVLWRLISYRSEKAVLSGIETAWRGGHLEFRRGRLVTEKRRLPGVGWKLLTWKRSLSGVGWKLPTWKRRLSGVGWKLLTWNRWLSGVGWKMLTGNGSCLE